MDQIKDIFSQSDATLKNVVKAVKDGIKEYTNSIENPTKRDLNKLSKWQASFTDLISSQKETQGLAKLIVNAYGRYDKYNDNMSDIVSYIKEYEKARSKILLELGFLRKAIETEVDDFELGDAIDVYMLKSESIFRMTDMLRSGNIGDDVDILQMIEDESNFTGKKSKKTQPKNTKKQEESSEESSSDLEDLKNLEDLALENDEDSLSLSDSIEPEPTNVEEMLSESEDLPESLNSEPIEFESDALEIDGGFNEFSSDTVKVGGEVYVVGEIYKFKIRELLMELKTCCDREEQVNLLGFKSESDLDKYCQNIDYSKYANTIIQKYGVSNMLLEALENLEVRVKSVLTQYKKSTKTSNKSIEGRFKNILNSIQLAKEDPVNWKEHLIEDESLYIMIMCKFALNQKDVVKKNVKNIKPFIRTTINLLAESEETVDCPKDINVKFEGSMSNDDNFVNVIKLLRNWRSNMTTAETYMAHSVPYINSLWDDQMSKPALYYRLYCLNNLKDCKYKSQLEKIAKKYKIGNYTDYKSLLNDFTN